MILARKIEELAIFGGAPLFQEPRHVGQPNIPPRQAFYRRVEQALERRWLSNRGPLLQEFEARLAQYLGVRHCVAVCNATIALQVAFRALELSGEVILPAFTFIASAHALQWEGIRPVFCDVDPRTHNIDPPQIERLITPRTRGVLGVHVWGRPCEVEAMDQICRRHRLTLLFDAAHAFGCSRQGRMIGGFGAAEVFSFHATKFFNTLEGGAIATDDDALAQRLRLMINFGFSGYDRTACLGTNGKLNEVSAAMGLACFEALDEFIAHNRRNYHLYRDELSCLPGVTMVHYDESERCNYQYIVLEIEPSLAQIDRDAILQILHAENVLARRYFYPGCHRMEPYRTLYPDQPPLPQTDRLARRVLALPTGTGVSPQDVQAICGLLQLILANGAELKRRLGEKGLLPTDAAYDEPAS